MEGKDYALIFQGQVAEGFQVAAVKESFTAFMACDLATTETLFSGRRLIFKRFASEEAARRAVEQLRQIGMVVEIAAVPKKEENQADLQLSDDETPSSDAGLLSTPPTSAPGAGVTTPVLQAASEKIESATAGGQPQERRLPFVFSGSGSEFFRIWIVNVLLTIVTVGIYSAWAKVRTLRYFYGNTSLDGSAFEYLADPVKILKGRLIAFAFIAVFSILTRIYPWTSLLYLLSILILMPWIIRQALRFRYHYTVWRGVRFSFAGNLMDAARAFIFWPVFSILLFTIPFGWHRQTHYQVDNSRFGATSFENRSTVGDFFELFFIMVGAGVVVGLIVVAIVAFGSGAAVFSQKAQMSKEVFPIFSIIFGGLFYVVIVIVVSVLYKVRMTTLRFGKTNIGPHQFVSSYAIGSYLALVITNTLFVILTLGLFYPWAKVRTAHYAAEHTALIINGDLDGFVAERQSEVSALGGAVSDFLDFDIGF
jgi:uncharacterized membrane protein YjgN (DUF898 family)